MFLFSIVLLWMGGLARADRTLNYLTTGNGHGFQFYDVSPGANKIVAFLDHPYRYVHKNPQNPTFEGIGRRQLAYDFYFGVRAAGTGTWLNTAPLSQDAPGYVDDTNIIHVALSVAGGTADTYYFAPFGLERNVMVALLKAPAGASDGVVLFNFHMGTGSPDSPGMSGESTAPLPAQQALMETGPGGGAMVYVPLSGTVQMDCQGVFGKVGTGLQNNPSCSGDDIVPGFQQSVSGTGGWMAVAVAYVEDPGDAASAATDVRTWAASRAPDKILGDVRAEWEAWRRPPAAGVNLSDDERHVWRQGETVLRMGQVRETYTTTRHNNGMMLASLPKGEWHSGWVRDAMYAIVALSRSGHHAEAKAALSFFLNAGPVSKFKDYVSGQDYRISVVRYYGDGEEEADYSGQRTPNVEIDGWGMFMWAARQYVDASGDAGWLAEKIRDGSGVYDTIVSGVASPLENNLEQNGIVKADSSIWEVHDANKRHYAYTTLAAARGFCDMATLAQRAGRMADLKKYQALSDKVVTGLYASFLDSQGAISGSIEGRQINKGTDAAVVEAFTWNILVDYKNPTAGATFDLLRKLLVESGGYKRNDDNMSSYDNNEWILIDLRLSDALRRAGRTMEADVLINTIVGKAKENFYLLPELYNAVREDGPIGNYTGSIPMVGYGGGAFLLTLMDRGGLIEPSDCGYSILGDGGVVATDGGMKPRQPMVANDSGGDTGFACFCRAAPGHRPSPGPGTLLLLLLPWILLGSLLSRRRLAAPPR